MLIINNRLFTATQEKYTGEFIPTNSLAAAINHRRRLLKHDRRL